ncbi:hybrid sensor histidine kinase/response regulator [Pseudomonas oryzihabitans]|uniref:histidine kinase n=2 Tax=Pseudomonas oryzihabitans TaxID=47885 RepID=A0A2Z5AET5_9PSED|nr:hybrid sensor histidine kinase/response regulator [Pseudomonas oryzihabitans]
MVSTLRAHDWPATPLGEIEHWPAPLQSSTALMISSASPMFIVWGDDLTYLYNDACAPILGLRHPEAFGHSFRTAWPEVWSELAPLVARAYAGEAFTQKDLPLRLERMGYVEDAFFTYYWTPIRLEAGTVGGFLGGCIETTGPVRQQLVLESANEQLQQQVQVSQRERDRLKSRDRLNVFKDRIRDLHDPLDMAAMAAQLMGTRLDVQAAAYAVMDEDGVYVHVERDWTAGSGIRLAGRYLFEDYGSYVEELRRGETVVIGDVASDPRTCGQADQFSALNIRSLINLPIMEHGRFVAAFFVVCDRPRQWREDEVAFIRDIADLTRYAVERRRAEQRLQALNANLEQQVVHRTRERNRVWEATNDLMGIATLDGYLKVVNPAWQQVLGWSESELLSRPLIELVDPDDRPSVLQVLERLARGETITGFVDRILTREGKRRTIMWTAAPDPGTELFHFVGRDLTDQREIEEALRQAQKMEAVGQLTGGLAHDFNNLLAAISGSLELMTARVSQGRINELDRYITTAQGATTRAAALTHRLLAFSRRQLLAPQPTDINLLVSGMLELIQRTVGPTIDVQHVGTTGLWSALVDAPQLESALLNLCINARDAMPVGGKITIETGNRRIDRRSGQLNDIPAGQYLSLCVSDNGSGMSKDIIARAFEPFFTTKPVGQGTGMGLSMIYGFAKQSGGQVRIYSEEGDGTMVCIYLPRHVSTADRTDLSDRIDVRESTNASEGETVLVVDDEPSVRMLVTEVLKELGYVAIEAADGIAGLKVLQSDVRIDLLVSDVGLPGGMNGRQMAEAARASRPDLKVLFISGFTEHALLNNGQLDPGMSLLTKPFAVDTLATRVRELIETKP